MFTRILRYSTLALLVSTMNCGGGPGACDETTKGYSTCRAQSCQPGQYCAPETATTYQQCENGCLSDANCGCGQKCVISPGQALGACQLTTVTPTTMPVCGNGVCEVGESTASCAHDCPSPVMPRCGDGVCNGDEVPATCSADCPDTDRCKRDCDSYNFFGCFSAYPGALQACYDSCAKASNAQIDQFDQCAGTATIKCDRSCLTQLPMP